MNPTVSFLRLGSSYGKTFSGARFASQLHAPGTSARLNSWFQRLARCLNKKEMPPSIAAATLQLLGAPDAAEAAARATPTSTATCAQGSDGFGEDSALSPANDSMRASTSADSEASLGQE
eukprot:s4323_g1.t1